MRLNKAFLIVFAFLFVPFFLAAQTTLFINEVNYLSDPANAGTADSPGLEISAPAGTVLNGYTLYFLEPNGSIYGTQTITGVVPNESVSRGDVWIEVVIFNVTSGAGILLTDDQGMPVQFMSFGGSIVGTNGIINNLSSEEVQEQTNPNNSLQLQGCGDMYTSFAWNMPGGKTPGSLNTGQMYECPEDGIVIALPVELSSFEVEEINQHSYVQWGTAKEANHQLFELEHSIDGINFEKITTVQSTTTENNGEKYSFLHMMPKAGVNYYRLLQIDLDGLVQNLGVRSVHIGPAAPTPIIYPNPVKEQLQLKLPVEMTDVQIEILDEYGKIFYSNYFSAANQLEISVAHFPSGTYLISTKSSERSDYQRFIKL